MSGRGGGVSSLKLGDLYPPPLRGGGCKNITVVHPKQLTGNAVEGIYIQTINIGYPVTKSIKISTA